MSTLANVRTPKALSNAGVGVVTLVHVVKQTSMNASPCLARMMPRALTALGNLPASACQVGSLVVPRKEFSSHSLNREASL